MSSTPISSLPWSSFPLTLTTEEAEKENAMKKLLAAILIAAVAFAAGHAATISTIDIQTDGDGDSAIVRTLGLEYFRGINGYTVD